MQFYEEYKSIKEKLEKKKHRVIIPLPNNHYQKSKNIKLKAMKEFKNGLNKSGAVLVANFDKERNPDYIGVNALMEKDMEKELEAIDAITLRGNLGKIK